MINTPNSTIIGRLSVFQNGTTIGDFERPIGSKLVANFTTGTYKASGVTKTFAEVFDFNRAGKAWLVKDTGLQEYVADVPRFDNGLLIEREATNLALYSNVLENTSTWSLYEVSVASNFGLSPAQLTDSNQVSFIENNSFGLIQLIKTPVSAGETLNVSLWMRSDTPQDIRIYLNGAINADNNIKGVVVQVTNEWAKFSTTLDILSDDSGIFGIFKSTLQNNSFEVWEVSIVRNSYSLTVIPTTTAPVTRPADFLQTKVSGTTVTGDWDSTLNLSIVDGQIVHTGYGRIRSLEIN